MATRKEIAQNQKILYDDAVANNMFQAAVPTFKEFQMRLEGPGYQKMVYDNYKKHNVKGKGFNNLNEFRGAFGGSFYADENKISLSNKAQAVSDRARQTVNNAGRYNRLKQRKQKQQNDFGRVNLGTHLTPFGGDANNVVKDEFAYNPVTGKFGEYVTSDNEYAYTQSDAEQKQAILDKYGEEWNKAVDMGMVTSELDKADPDMSDTDVAMRQMERRQEWLDENQNRRSQELNESMHLQDSPFVASGGAVAPSSFNAAIGNEANRLSDAEYGAYNTAKAYNQMLRTTLLQDLKEQNQRNENAGWWKDKWNDVSNYFGAMFNTMLDPKLYSQGVMDAAIASNLRQVKKGMEEGTIKKGSNAGNAAQVMLSAIQQQQGESAKQQQYGTKAYQYGDVSGRSLKFMADFALSGWRNVMTTGFTKAGEKVGEKMALGALGKWFTKNTGRVLGDMAGSAALAATNQLGSTYNNVIERYVGMNNENGGVTQDKDGDLSFNKGVSLGKAIKDGLGSATIENFSEMFGEYLPGASKLLSKLGLSKVSSFFEKIGNNAYYKWLSNATNKSGIQGVMAEISEEEFGTAIHAAWGDGDGSWSDFNVFTNPDAREKQIDTCLGMFYSVGFMQSPRTAVGAINAVKYFNIKHQVTKADKFGQMMFGGNWDEIKNKIDVTTNADLTKTVLDATRSDSMTAKQKGAVINYAMFLSKLRGFNQASDAKTKDKVEEGETAPTLSNDLDDAYTEGHNANDADKHDIQIQHEDQSKTLAAALNISEQQLSGMSDEELESLTGQDDKLDQAIYDYQLSSARYQGVVDDAQDKVDLAAHQAEQRVNMYTDQSRGSVRNATIKASGGAEDYGVYIISGNIATHEDGSIDVSNSDDMILYFDPTTNSVEHADALMFAELGEELPADDVKAQAVADAKDNAIKEIAGIIDGTVYVGSKFSVTDADGTEHTYEVLADNGDGTAMITIDGNVPTELVNGENVQIPYSFEDLQNMKDLEDQKRLEAAKAEREQMEKERAEQQMQSQTTQAENPAHEDNIQSAPIKDNIKYSDIIREDGNVQMVDVSDKYGNNLFPDAKDVFYIQGNKIRTKFAYIDANGELKTQSFPTGLVKIKTRGEVSVDDYKKYRNTILAAESSFIPESSKIEDNSGENRGEIEAEAPTIEGETAGSAEETATSESGNDSATEQTPTAEQTPAITLEDGTIVPMLEDGNPDFSKLSAAQTAELYDTQFDEDAEGIVSGYVSDAKKALDKANNMTVKGKTFVEQKASKDAKEKAIADAQAAYDSAVAIRDAYNERQLAKEENTPEGRKSLIEKAKRKFARLKNSEEWSERTGDLWNETVGKLLHRLYDATGIDVFDDTPNTVYEYVAANVGPYSLNYEGNDNSNGVQQETGLSRSDFAKLGWLAAEGKGMTIDEKVHRLWENRPSNLESADTQEIRNALISLITSGQTAFQTRDYILNQRIELAESALEEQLRQEEDAAEAQMAKEEEEKKKAELEKKADEKTHSDAFNKIIDLAKNLEEILDSPDNVKEIDKITHEIDELLETLSGEEFKEVSDALLNIDEDFDYLTADEYERREGVEESKKAKAYNESLQQAIKRIEPYADSLKVAVKSGDKKAVANAQKELTDALLESNLGHGYLSWQLEYAKSAKKKDESYSERRALVKPLTDAINAIESALDSAMAEAGLEGVHVDFKEGGHGWIYAENGSAWSSILKALDNDYRNVSQYETQNPISVLPQVNMDNVEKVAGIIKSRIKEGERYNSDKYNDEENEKINEQTNENISAVEVPEDATDEAPLGAQRDESDLPFSAKENGKQQTTAERAADVEKNKVDDMKVVDNIVGEKTRKAFDRLAKMMGANIQWQYSDKLGNGWIQETTDADGNVNRTIYITLDSSITEGAQFIFGHEMTHQIKNLNPAAYNELTQLVLDTYGSDAFEKAVDETMKRYSDAGFSGRARDYYAEEVVADAVGEMIRDLNLAHTLAMKMSHPLLAAIHEILQKIKLAFFGTEYSDATKNIIRSIEQAYVKTANREAIDAATQEGEGGQRLSLRTKPEPKKTQKVYKLMRLGEDGKLYPLFIGSGEAIELGKWYDADSPKLQDLTSLSSKDYVGTRTAKKDGASVKEEYHYGAYIVNNKTGEAMSLADFKAKYSKQFDRMGNNPNKKAVDWATDNGYRWIKIEEKNQGQSRYGGEARSYYNYGINGSGSVSIFAMRPGWHAGSLPTMRQIGKGSAKNLRDDTFVWVEGEIPAEIDYNEEAQKNADKDIPDHIPTDGYYLKATNANKEASQADKVGWYVAGAFRANRIMSDKETRDIVDEWNAAHPDDNVEYDWKRESGKDFNAETMSLEDTPKFSLKVYHGSGADFTEFDFDHMGEGAGSQVFGWGGYVTSSKKIGKSYANLVYANAPHQDVEYVGNNAHEYTDVVAGLFNGGQKDYDDVKEFLQNGYNSDKDNARKKQMLEWFESTKPSDWKSVNDGKRNLYEVDIPDDNGSNYLDWEKTLNEEQINSIRDVLIKNGVDVSSWEKRGFKLDLPFKNVYAAVLPMMMRCEPKELSKFLSSLGFTGIKYPAGTIQGGAEEGDTNYVIFKPEDMKITEHTKFSIKTYHGSQASFDHFDHSFMGSGEGAQAYGWGTYVSEVKGIAKAYAKQNTAKRNTEYTKAKSAYESALADIDFHNNILDGFKKDIEYQKENIAQKNEMIDEVTKYIKENYDKDSNKYKDGIRTIEKFKKIIDRANETIESVTSAMKDRQKMLDLSIKERDEAKAKLDSTEKPKRNLYSVDIPDDTGENYIGWDEKMTPRMRDIRKEILEDNGYKLVDSDGTRDYFEDRDGKEYDLFKEQYKTGGTFYEELAQLLHSQKLASLALKEYGFDGVKVIAERNTGGNKEGKMNYVIFDENNAQITNHTKFSLRLKSAIEETETNPSDAQKESGNYKKGHIKFGGYDYTIENPKGSTRSGKDADGKEWKITMHDTYGYIRGKFGKDGDHLDMFINDKADLDNWNGDVFVVDQVNPDGSFDEHKVMYGYDSMDDAEKAYLANYSKGWKGLGNITGASKTEFDKWLDTSNRKIKPFADYAKVKFSQAQSVSEHRYSLKDEKTLAGVHNITEEKLRKALKLGGFANPSLAVIDTNKTGHDNFGEISFIAPSALLDKHTGKTAGTWITDAYTQRYPSVERQMSEKGSQKFRDWVDSLEYQSEAKAEIKRQAEDALSNNNAPAWELMYLKEKGIDIKEYNSKVDYRWKEIISDHTTAEDILSSMQNDSELNEKVISLVKHTIIHPTWEKISLEVRRKIYEETGNNVSPINPKVRKQTKEIFERDYAPSLLNKNGTPKKSDVKKVVEQMVKEHNDTKKYDFYLSKVKARDYVNKKGMYDDYIRWQEKKLDEFGTKNRIFRGYKPDGTRKYVPETLENVSKAMREEAGGQTNGSEYTSFGSFIAKIASRVDSTDEMRDNKDKLSSNEDKEEFYDKWSMVYYDLAKFLYNDVFYGEQRLHDIVLQSDPKKYAKKEYGITLTPTFMKKLDALKNAVQTELKSAYFETKYNRPLRLNEFAAVVVPDNLGEDVRKGIENAGLPMFDYEPNKEGDRSRAFNEAVNSSDNIRFSLKQTNDKFNSDLKSYVENGILPENSRFELGFPSDTLLSAGFPKLPISMRVSLLNKKAGMERHPFSPTDLYNLVDAIQEPLAIFEYTKPNMHNLIVDLTKGEKHFLVGVTLDYRKGDLDVNSISGLFPKENHEWIKWIQDGKAIRIDKKDKVLSLINSLRTNPEEAERIGLNLDSAAKIIKDFENPSVSSENSSSDTKFSLRGSTSYEKQMEEWKEKNHLENGAVPMEKPTMKEGENIFDYANRMVEWTRNQNLWKTAPKQTGFQDALAKWKDDNGLSPDAYPPVRPHREYYSSEIGYSEDLEEYNKKKELWKSAPKPKDFDLSVDLEDMNKQLRNIRRAVLNQKNYDQRTVKAVSDLVRKMLNIGWGDGLSRGKVGNLLSAAKNATGANDVKKYLDKAMGILAENYLNRLSTAYENLINTKGARADQSGVIKIGSLDDKGQAFMSEYKKAINMDDSSLNTYIANIDEDSAKNEDNVETNDYRLAGIQAAIMYKQQIGGNDADISELKRQIGELKNKKDATKEDKDLLKSLEKKLFENKFDRITMYENLLNNIQRMVKESKGRAKEFREEITEHKNEILHRANLDLEGVDSTYYDTTTAKKKFVNNDLQRAVFSSTYTFEQFLKFFGKHSANGEGRLYNYFHKLNQDALDEEQLYNEMNRNALDEKTKELFGKNKFMKLVGIDGKGMKEMDIEVTDYSNKETGKRTIHLKQGQMLYIYLVNKETDGEMKLRAMGITEEDVAAIEENLDQRVKAMGEWLQDEYLPECQRRYQDTHTKYFGAPMKEVENYFPIAINNRARNVKEDVNQDSDAMSQLAGTSTGAIVTRRVNVIPLDIENADAFEVAFNHLQEMEEWSAMLPFRQDINTLLSYTHFRNQVQNMSSVAYGSGKTLWDEFKQTAQIAAGTYKPKVNAGMMDSRIAAAMGGIAVAKISGRLWTAIKQSQSATAFLPECDFTRFVKNGVNPYGSWKWAMENIPDFRKRVENMTYGDVKLKQYLDELEKWHDWTKTISKIGMAPNILVDGITCAVGARSVYETEVNRLTKLGYPKDKADEKAYYKAVAAYNKTQQSSGGMYLSPMQVDRTYVSAALSLFKNANYAYGRMQIEACRGLARTYDFWGGKHKTTLVESMTRQIMGEDGLDENTARAIAKATYKRTFRQSIGRLINFATLVPVSWALYKVLPYLLAGDDDDKKKDMIEEAVLKGFATSLSDNYVIPFASNILNAGLNVEDGKPTFDPDVFRYQNLYINPATSDLANIYSMIGNQKWYSVANKFGMLGVQSLIGFNPETVGALYQAFAEADYDNGNAAKEWQIGILKAISAPEESIRELYMDELGLKSGDIKKIPLEELEKRYADRQINRDNLLSQVFMDAETFNGYVDKYQKSFEKKIKDKMDKWDEYDKKKADEFFDTTSDHKLKDMIEKKRTKDANAAADEQIAKEGLSQEKKGKELNEVAYDAVKMSIDVAEDNAISTYNKVLNKRYAALNDEYNNQADAMKYIFMSKHPNFKAYKDLESEYTNYCKKIKELKEKLVSADGYDAKQTIMKQIRAEREKFSKLQSKVR